ncbi:hypothetical protein M0R72_18950 [Candidatus Pacearchaeota archaeon]|jgi:hypothetical protein|nr:hypothetical protein [Candidatus Pacearchaeota archaeon]
MEELRIKIESAFDNVINARKGLLDAKEVTANAKCDLTDAEVRYILSGLSGKNEKEREAQLWRLCAGWRDSLTAAEKDERVATLALEMALDARRNLESILKIEEMEKFEEMEKW